MLEPATFTTAMFGLYRHNYNWRHPPLEEKSYPKTLVTRKPQKSSIATYMMNAGSFLLLTQKSFSHFSFFLVGNCVLICLNPACVGRISHHGASIDSKEMKRKLKWFPFHFQNKSPMGQWATLLTWPTALNFDPSTSSLLSLFYQIWYKQYWNKASLFKHLIVW